MNSLISVILPTYNGSRYLTQAIESVLSQDYRDLELIIIDDASSDVQVGEIIWEFIAKDPRVRSFRNEKNRERSWSKNFWVRQSKWDYIAFIDDDDIWHPEKLSRQIARMKDDTHLGIIGTFARFIDEKWVLLSETSHLKTTPIEIRKNILLTNQFIHSSVFVRKSVFEKVGGFPTHMHLCEDYDLWFRIISLSDWANISEYLIDYRVRTSSTTARNIYRMKWISLVLTWKYRKDFPLFFRSILSKVVLFPLNAVFLLKIWNKFWRRKQNII